MPRENKNRNQDNDTPLTAEDAAVWFAVNDALQAANRTGVIQRVVDQNGRRNT